MRADAERHSRTINRLASTVSHAKPKDMTVACELVEDVETQLFALQSELRAVLAQFPNFPMVGPLLSACPLDDYTPIPAL